MILIGLTLRIVTCSFDFLLVHAHAMYPLYTVRIARSDISAMTVVSVAILLAIVVCARAGGAQNGDAGVV